jgi:hypothetical protein
MTSSTVLPRLLLIITALEALFVSSCNCLNDPLLPVIFYPFGSDQLDNTAPVNDDGFTPAVPIGIGFPFFKSARTSVFVSNEKTQ